MHVMHITSAFYMMYMICIQHKIDIMVVVGLIDKYHSGSMLIGFLQETVLSLPAAQRWLAGPNFKPRTLPLGCDRL